MKVAAIPFQVGSGAATGGQGTRSGKPDGTGIATLHSAFAGLAGLISAAMLSGLVPRQRLVTICLNAVQDSAITHV